MTDLPDVNDLVGGTTTEAEFQAALSDLYEYIAEDIGSGSPEEVSIVLGSITPSKGHIVVDTENTSASDDLDNIVPTNLGQRLLLVQCKSNARPVTLKHNQSGSGKLIMVDGLDAVLYEPNQVIMFKYDSNTDAWLEKHRNFGIYTPNATLKAAARTALGLSEIVTKAIGTNSGQVPTADLLGGLAFLNSIGTAQLADNAITTAKIGNSQVTEQKLADDAVALSKMKHGSVNKMIGYSSDGTPVEYSAGSNVSFSGNAINVSVPSSGLTSVGQGDLRTSTGSFSFGSSSYALFGGNNTLKGARLENPGGSSQALNVDGNSITLPGGQYGFIPVISVGSSTTQRYITSSPPYDLGDGEVGGFIFLLVDSNGEIKGHYAADAPPWAYNGPTNITACKKCPETGKKYRKVPKTLSIEAILDGEPMEFEYQEITHEIKNADMPLIPHPFNEQESKYSIVLADPMSPIVRNLIDAQNNYDGFDMVEMLKHIRIDNEALNRKGPHGVMQVGVSKR